MRSVISALLLCSLAVVDVSCNRPPLIGPALLPPRPLFPPHILPPFGPPLIAPLPPAPPAERWDEVNKVGNVAVSTAKDLVNRVLELENGKYYLYMDLAVGSKFNPAVHRHLKYRYYFRIKTKDQPPKEYKCKAQITWPKDEKKPSFDPLPPGETYNVCS